MDYIGNAFSVNMLSEDSVISIKKCPADRVPRVGFKSCIGHASTTETASALLGFNIPMNREAVSLKTGDRLFVLAIFYPDGRPFRATEGQILGAEELAVLKLEWRCVKVSNPISKQAEEYICHLLGI